MAYYKSPTNEIYFFNESDLLKKYEFEKITLSNELVSYEDFLAKHEAEILPEGSVKVADEEAIAISAAQSEANKNARPYTEKRASEYPPMVDYLDGIVKGDAAQVQRYIDACLAVKLKYPKPTE